ncbi:MAG TPA: glycosyltransferase family 4 protein [Thermoanaerobaculia bacterium]|nr:glycosyltransferase family 4 protein [Thermoanaerobaculia bacterium]
MGDSRSSAGALERAPVDWVSPLPPVRSGIADYSAEILPFLEHECDLRVIAVPGQEIDAEIVRRHRPVPLERAGEGGRLPLYQVGNNSYHAAIVERALIRPGVVTLHDVVLHHLLQERTLAHGDLDGYVRALVADHGWIGGAVALVPRWHGYGRSALFALPAHRTLLSRQRGLIVHSSWARDVLREEGIATPTEVVAMPMPVPPALVPGTAAAFRARHRIPAGALVLGSLGFQTPIKRTAVVLRALATRGLEGVYLVVGGAASPAIDLEALARELGVAERVRITGFLEAEEYRAAIAACDLCVNLRYPTAGETSAALLRVAAHGRPVVVSDFGQFAELPEEIAVRVPLDDGRAEGEEVAGLVRLVREALEDRSRLAAAGRRARDWVERHHRPERVARHLGGILAAWSRAGARDAPEPVAPAVRRPTSLTWGRFEGALRVLGAERWSPGERRIVEIRLRNVSFARWLAAEAGPGGLALEVSFVEGSKRRSCGPWLPIQTDLEPLGEAAFRLTLRRPLEDCRLRIEPHVIGAGGFAALGGPVWEAAV